MTQFVCLGNWSQQFPNKIGNKRVCLDVGQSGTGDGEYLSVSLHGLQVFTRREEAELRTGQVIR